MRSYAFLKKGWKSAEKVARYKIQTGKQVLDPEREKVKIDGVKAKAHTSFNAMGTGELFKLIMASAGRDSISCLPRMALEAAAVLNRSRSFQEKE